MPRIVHLNGPPGIGKSTLARRYVDDHPLAFCLDVDGFRGLIGRWEAHPEESGRLARRMALAMAREHLSAGHDVVVPQFVARRDFIDRMSETAADVRAGFVEVVLVDERSAALARFEQRALDPEWAVHHEKARRMLDAAGGFFAMYDALMDAVEQLPDAVSITTTAGDIDGAYRALMDAVRGM